MSTIEVPVRCLFSSLVIVGAAVGIAPAPAAPVPPEARKPLLYYPTRVGTELVYEKEGSEVTHVVTAVEEKDGAKIVSVGEVVAAGKPAPHEKMQVSEKGLIRMEITGQKITPPLVMLRVPHPKGDKWEFTASGAWSGEVKGSKIVIGPERLTVPAGTFETIRVESAYTLNGQQLQATFWYSPIVGLVKLAPLQGVTMTLKEYRPVKE
jgi:hypothetical protein